MEKFSLQEKKTLCTIFNVGIAKGSHIRRQANCSHTELREAITSLHGKKIITAVGLYETDDGLDRSHFAVLPSAVDRHPEIKRFMVS